MMQRLATLGHRLRTVLTRSVQERDMAEEMRFHIEMEAADLARRGVRGDEALRRARAGFGDVERFKDEVRDARLAAAA